MIESTSGGDNIRQTPKPAAASGLTLAQPPGQPAFRPALLNAGAAAREVYGVSERTFHEMRAKGLVPPAVVLGPRLLRWHRHELEAAIASMPRQQAPQAAPEHLVRGKAESLKARRAAAAGK